MNERVVNGARQSRLDALLITSRVLPVNKSNIYSGDYYIGVEPNPITLALMKAFYNFETSSN